MAHPFCIGGSVELKSVSGGTVWSVVQPHILEAHRHTGQVRSGHWTLGLMGYGRMSVRVCRTFAYLAARNEDFGGHAHGDDLYELLISGSSRLAQPRRAKQELESWSILDELLP